MALILTVGADFGLTLGFGLGGTLTAAFGVARFAGLAAAAFTGLGAGFFGASLAVERALAGGFLALAVAAALRAGAFTGCLLAG
ncbi:MAG: hypothetical protein Q7T63_00800 [Burkholderiaceae bacterium]|nr:hypothetical protein [Burkholderiaceae bacterium]